jgi:hypothetical protein
LTASAGLFSGSGAELFNIPASAVVGLALNQITTGSVSASVNLGTNTFTVQSGSVTFLNITNQGAATITGSLTVSGSSTFTNIGPAIFSGSITQNASTASFGGRVGIGTTSPSSPLHIKNSAPSYLGGLTLEKSDASLTYNLYVDGNNSFAVSKGASQFFTIDQSGNAGVGISSPTAKLQVRGSGTTLSTTSFLVQNSAGTQYFKVDDDGTVYIATSISMNGGTIFSGVWSGGYINSQGNAYTVMTTHNSTGNASFWQSLAVGTTAQPNSAYKLDVSGSGNFTNNLTVTGSIITNSALTASSALINGNVVIRGTASVDVLITNYESSSIIYSSGSTKFGDTLDDTHEFTGSLYITGSTVSLQGGSFSGSGANLFNIPASGITGLNLSQIATGSISASVSLGTGSFTISSGSSNFLFISSSGNIGIGTTTPTAKLTVSGSGIHTRLGDSNASSLVLVRTTGSDFYIGSSGNTRFGFAGNDAGLFMHLGVDDRPLVVGTFNGTPLVFGTNNNETARFDASGNFGIGTTSSISAKLQVKGTGTTSSTTALLVQNSNLSSSLAVLDDGRVGIGTTTPSYQLSVVTPNANDGIVAYVGSSGMIMTGNAGFGNPGISSTSGVIHVAATLNGTGGSEVLNVNKSSNGAYIQAWRSQASSILTLVAGDGSIGIKTSTPSASLHVVGNTILSGSAGTGSALLVYKSGSTVVDVQGSQGQLFSIVDALSGSLMSVNDISGLPILEVFSDDRVVMGTYGAPGLTVTGSTVIASGSFSGSFFGNGSGLTNISASSIVGLNLSQIATGSISASVSTGTGSFTVSSGSTSFLFVSSSGNVGIGTTTPAYTLDINGTTRLNSSATVTSDLSVGLTTAFGRFNVRGADNSSTSRAITVQNQGQSLIFDLYNDGKILLNPQGAGNILVGTITDSGFKFDVNGTGRFSGNVQITGSATNSLLVKGSGATSATTSLLVQNSSNTQLLKLTDDGQFYILANDSILTGLRSVNHTVNSNQGNFNSFVSWNNNNGTPSLRAFNDDGNASIGIGTTVREASAVLFLQSTTRGFLLPRTNLTTNISTPARGLMTYITASATEGIWYYNSGSYQGWTRVLNDTGSQSISGSFTVVGASNLGGATFSNGGATFVNNVNLGAINEGTGNSWINFNTTRVHIGQNGSSAGLNVISATQYVAIGKGTANTTLDVLGDVLITGSLNASYITASGALINGNLTVIGTASFTYTTASSITIGGNLITLNTDNPAVRFGGLTVVDSGSFGTSSTGSLLWDSQNNKWIYSNPSGSSYDGGMLISGPRNTSGLGNEEGTTLNALMKGQGGDHITSSGVFEVSGSVGIGTSSPSASLDVSGSGRFTNGLTNTGSFAQSGSSTFNGGTYLFKSVSSGDGGIQIGTTINGYTGIDWISNNVGFGLIAGGGITTKVTSGMGFNIGTAGTTNLGAMLGVKGSGTTSSTTALLVQNSGATASLAVLDNGNVGIGTTSPNAKLDIRINQANTTTVPYLNLVNDASGYVGYTFSKVGSNDLGLYGNYTVPPAMVWKYVSGTNSYVGINTASPAYTLDVSGSGNFTSNLTVTGSLLVSGSSTFTNIGPAVFSGSITQNASTASFGGLVGIGTTSPAVGLDARNGFNLWVGGGHYLEGLATSGTDVSVVLRRTANNGWVRYALGIGGNISFGANMGTGEVQLMAPFGGFFPTFYSNGSEAMRIPTTGNVLIGTTTDAGFKLDVNGTTKLRGNVDIVTSGNSNVFLAYSSYVQSWQSFYVSQAGGTHNFAVSNASSGGNAYFNNVNVGIGNSSPAYTLDVSGSGNFTNNLTVTGSLNLTSALTASNAIISGNVTVLGTASINTLIVNQTQLSTGSNQLGDAADDFQTLYGTVRIPTGSLTVTGSTNISGSFTVAGRGNTNIGDIGYSTINLNGGVNVANTGPNTGTSLSISGGGNTAMRFDWDNINNVTTVVSSASRILRFTGASQYQVRGSGTTSSTTAFLVQNANASSSLSVTDDGVVTFHRGTYMNAASSNFFHTIDTGDANYGGIVLKNNTQDYAGYITTGRSGNGNSINFLHTTFAGAFSASPIQQFNASSVTFGRTNGTSPNILTVYGTPVSNITSNATINVAGSINTTNTGAKLAFQCGTVDTGAAIDSGGIVVFKTNIGSSDNINTRMVFYNRENTTLIERMRIADTGNILIGTTTDSGFKLDISGSGRFTSNLTVTGSVIIDGGLFDTLSTGSLATGSTLLYSVNTGSYSAGFFDYYAISGSNGRSGTIMSFWLGGEVRYSDNSTPDVGNTSNIAFSMSLAGANAQLFASASSAGWNVKTTFRTI